MKDRSHRSEAPRRRKIRSTMGWFVAILAFISAMALTFTEPAVANPSDGEAAVQEEQQCLKFLALGDWGTKLLRYTAKSMRKYANGSDGMLSCNQSVSSLLLVGDNFYDQGITSTNDTLVREVYYENFRTPEFDNISFSVVLGNHDHRGIVQRQVEMTEKDEIKHWYLPRLFYSRTFEYKDVKVLFVFIDTWELVGGEAEVHGNSQRIIDAQQLRWIKDILRTNDVDYKVVVGHYPIRSARRETEGLVKDLLPILQDNNVDAYIFGHDHIAQHIERDGLHYFGSGLGGRIYDGPLESTPGLKYSLRNSLGFLSFVFDENEMTVRVHQVVHKGNDDQITYTTTVPNRRKTETDEIRTNLAMRIRSAVLGNW